jgi:hypothetical protein
VRAEHSADGGAGGAELVGADHQANATERGAREVDVDVISRRVNR